MGKKKDTPADIIEAEEKLPDFDELLVQATDIEQKLKSLWVQIYRNACTDREQANVFLTDLTRTLTGGDADKHSVHGPQAVRYLERVGKSNEQLLKLAEQIKDYRARQGAIDSDDMLDQIQSGR